MADRKLTELPVAAAVNTGDKIQIVRESEADPTERNKQATVDVLQTFISGQAAAAQVALTDGVIIPWDLETAANAVVTLGGNRAMGAPANPATGAFYALLVKQDSAGGRTLAWNAAFDFTNVAGTPVISSGASDQDLLLFMYLDSKMTCLAIMRDI